MKKFMYFITIMTLLFLGCSKNQYRPIEFTEDKEIKLWEYRSQKHRPNQEAKDLALAVAISGGGHRAANFGIGVLLALEEHGILKEVDYLSTVSGGSFAGAAYIESLISHLEMKKPYESYSLKSWMEKKTGKLEDKSLRRHLERGYHFPLILGMVNPIYWWGKKDRGDVLEKKIDNRLLGFQRRKNDTTLSDKRRGSRTLSDVFCYKNKPNVIEQNACKYMVPYWISNATIYENGAIFPFTPDFLEKYKISQFTHRGWRKKLKNDKTRLPLAVAVKASASFPVAVPPTTLKSDYEGKENKDRPGLYLHLLDGGLADNIGFRTAISLLKKDDSKTKVLLIVDAYKGKNQPFSSKEAPPSRPVVGFKTTTMGLTTSHDTLKEDVARMCPECHTFYLDFESVKPEDVLERIAEKKCLDGKESKNPDDIEAYKNSEKYKTCIEAYKNSGDGTEYVENQEEMYERIRKVRTLFNVSKKKQELLIAAGKVAVKNKIDDIERVVFGN